MSKFIRTIILIGGISTFLLVGCTNKHVDNESQMNKDKATTIEKEDDVAKDEDNKTEVISGKEKYLTEMDNLDKDLNTRLKDKLAGTTIDMKEAESEIYKSWDEMLNKVYSEITSKLSQEEKDKLISEENNWIKKRDEEADKEAKKVEGGTMESLAKITSLAESTKERCYELVNNYME